RELERRLSAARPKLLERRNKRVPPGLDDKTLAEWNGMMIASLARGGAVLDEEKYVAAAAKAAAFILEKQYENGRLLRAYRDGHTLDTAFLTDYACMIDGLLELYEATFDKRWLDHAIELNRAVVAHYYDEERGGFFLTADDHERLITRSKDVRDGATPSGNSVQLMNLLRLSVILGDQSLREMAEKGMDHFAAEVMQMPGAGERFLAAVEFALVGPVELAVVGDPSDANTRALLKKIHETYLPNRVLLLLNPADAANNVDSPLLQNRTLVEGHPAVYVCRNYACQRPVTTPVELKKQLDESSAQSVVRSRRSAP
ncbi:MAG: thioredoxin domain-containing protein, partial [Phycisphaerae bacterium]